MPKLGFICYVSCTFSINEDNDDEAKYNTSLNMCHSNKKRGVSLGGKLP